MEKITSVLTHLAAYVERTERVHVPYAGPIGGRYENRPAEIIQILYVKSGVLSGFCAGEVCVDVPAGWIALTSLHHGVSMRTPSDALSISFYLDVTDAPEFIELGANPFVLPTRLSRVERFVETLRLAAARCYLPTPFSTRAQSWRTAHKPLSNSEEKAATLMARAAMFELIGVLWDEFHSSAPDGGAQAIARACDFMAANLADDELTLADVAESAKLSVNHFGRLFCQQTGMTPMRYLRELRMGHARFLLTSTALRVGEVAVRVGFTDPLHFSRVFRRVVGQSPSDFRG